MQQTSIIIIIILILYVSLVDERGNLEIETDEKGIDETGIDETTKSLPPTRIWSGFLETDV